MARGVADRRRPVALPPNAAEARPGATERSADGDRLVRHLPAVELGEIEIRSVSAREQADEGRPLVFRPLPGAALDNPVVASLPRGVAPSALVSEALAAVREYWVATDAALARA